MLKQLITAGALAAAVTFSGAAAHAYTPYTPEKPKTVSAPVGDYTVKASGYAPGSTVTISVKTASGTKTYTTTADASGNISYTVKLATAGSYTITASGQDSSGAAVESTQTVTAATPTTSTGGSGSTSGKKLAKTGPSDLGPQLWMGSGLVAAGAALVGVMYTRRQKTESN